MDKTIWDTKKKRRKLSFKSITIFIYGMYCTIYCIGRTNVYNFYKYYYIFLIFIISFGLQAEKIINFFFIFFSFRLPFVNKVHHGTEYFLKKNKIKTLNNILLNETLNTEKCLLFESCLAIAWNTFTIKNWNRNRNEAKRTEIINEAIYNYLTFGSCAVVVPVLQSIFSMSEDILPLIISVWCILFYPNWY